VSSRRSCKRSLTVGAAILAAVVALGCHRIVASREVAARMFVGAALDGGLVGIVRVDSLEACLRGSGEARLLPLAGDPDLAEDPFLTVECSRISPLTAEELSSLFEGKGGARGEAEIPENDSPIADGSRGYVRIPGESFWIEYYLRYNRAFIRLVEWSSGNHWGVEVDHTYRVELAGSRRVMRTIRSREREVELD
jgi:hypothetical protein